MNNDLYEFSCPMSEKEKLGVPFINPESPYVPVDERETLTINFDDNDDQVFGSDIKANLKPFFVNLMCKTINIGNSHDRYFTEMFGYKLPVDGNDIMQILNIGPCKKVKEVQDSLMEFVFNHGIVDRETLVKEIEDFK